MAKRISVIHARVNSSMTLGSRMSRLEKRFDKVAYEMGVLKNNASVEAQIAALQKKLLSVGKKAKTTEESLKSQDAKIRDLVEARENLLAEMASVIDAQQEGQARLDALEQPDTRRAQFQLLQEALKKFQASQAFVSGRLQEHENGPAALDLLRVVDDSIQQILAIKEQARDALVESVRVVESLTQRLASLHELITKQATLFDGMDWRDRDGALFEAKIEWILSCIAKFLAVSGDQGVLHVRVLRMLARLRSFVDAATVASLRDDVTELQGLEGELGAVKAQMEAKPAKQEMQEMLDRKVREATELVKVEIMRDVRFELTEALRDVPQIGASDAQSDEGNLDEELSNATKKIEDLRSALFGKVEIKDLDLAIASLQTQIKKVAAESARKEQVDWLARDKVGKGELEKLAGSLGPFGTDDEDPVIASRKAYTCLSCNRPLPSLGKPSMAMPETSGHPEVVTRTASPPPSASPVHRNAPKAVELLDSAAQYTLDPVYLENGRVVSRYPRIMPPKMRVQMSAGGLGNVPRSLSRFAPTR